MKAWTIEKQNEFDFMDCYQANYPLLDLNKYKNDRNYRFYELQNKLQMEYVKTSKINNEILWQMYPYILGVVESVAKKKICTGCKVPDFESKTLEAALRIINFYKLFPFFKARKLENVAFWKCKEVFHNPNLQINERVIDFDYLLSLEAEQEQYDIGDEECLT